MQTLFQNGLDLTSNYTQFWHLMNCCFVTYSKNAILFSTSGILPTQTFDFFQLKKMRRKQSVSQAKRKRKKRLATGSTSKFGAIRPQSRSNVSKMTPRPRILYETEIYSTNLTKNIIPVSTVSKKKPMNHLYSLFYIRLNVNQI